jgi:DNA polymerase-3 subunit gamma/tau
MENFIVSARKYRPQQFESVVGQGHVTRTLENAIKQNHLAQALLFTGPRGVGKTTCARILAKMINLDDAEDENQDFSFNIFELDAASNNTVDDIRNLIDQVRYAPQAGKYKVYIIDEVHMLSQAAFNAFLKTLEEPPAHAIFILATTEKHKIIPTILSRCQIFDFKRIGVEDIAAHLKGVAEKEGITAEHEALHIIAQKADGALRDALSIFDRIVSFSGNNITYKDVIDNLRILDYDYYFQTTDLIRSNDKSGLMLLFKDILDRGFDGHLFVNGLAAHLRDLLMCKNPKTLSLLEVADSTKERYKEQSAAVPVNFLIEGLKLTAETDYRYKSSNNQNLLVELCLLNLAQLHAAAEKKKPNSELEEATGDFTDTNYTGNGPIDSSRHFPLPKRKIPPTEALAPTAAVAPKEAGSPEKTHETVSPAPVKTATPNKLTTPSPAATPVRGRRERSSSFSINAALNSNKVEETEQEEEDVLSPDPGLPKDGFDQLQLNNLWQDYLNMLRDQDERKLYSSLSNKAIVLKENFEVDIELETEIQLSLFVENQAQLLRFMREKLNNYSLVFTPRVTEIQSETEPYSAQEKFSYMAEKNPVLLKLKERLDMEIN